MKLKIIVSIITLILLSACSDNEKIAAELMSESEDIFLLAKRKTGEYEEKIKDYNKAQHLIEKIKSDYSETEIALSSELKHLKLYIEEEKREATRWMKKQNVTRKLGGSSARKGFDSLLF
jgi:hypothetical protein